MMMREEGSFSMLSDLGTVQGDEVGDPKYAGPLPMTPEVIYLLSQDSHGFEKLLRASAGHEVYHYLIFFQSYGPNWGEEWTEDERYTDATGPLHVYHKTSDMPCDLWYFWNITNNYEDPIYGAQPYTINSLHTAPLQDWRYMGKKDYSSHAQFKGWSLDPLWTPPTYTIPVPSAPPADELDDIPMATENNIVKAMGTPGPVVMVPVPGYGMCQIMKEQQTQRSLWSCLPFKLS